MIGVLLQEPQVRALLGRQYSGLNYTQGPFFQA